MSRCASDEVQVVTINSYSTSGNLVPYGVVIVSVGSVTYHLQLIHGYNCGTSLRSMTYDWHQYNPKVKRIMPGDNPGITVRPEQMGGLPKPRIPAEIREGIVTARDGRTAADKEFRQGCLWKGQKTIFNY